MKLRTRILAAFAVVLIAFSLVFTGVNTSAFAIEKSDAVYTNSLQKQFDKTNVLDDLKSEKNFNVLSYPFYNLGTPEMYVINVVEFCYSFDIDRQNNYGLYLYIYNPNGLEIDTNSNQNQVSIAVAYNSNPVTKDSKPIDYEMFKLKFCSVSDGDYANLFYKFKVIDHKGNKDGKTILERVNSNARRYDIAEIQLIEQGQQNAVAYPLSGFYSVGINTEECYGTFYFTGYAKGFGADKEADSTLAVEYQKLDTISLSLNHTYWRSQTSSLGKFHQNQIDTVYFAVPNKFFEQYEELQRIKAEWYEYKTKDIIVTSNSKFYNTAKNYLGKTNTGNVKDWDYGLITNFEMDSDVEVSSYYGDWGWNASIFALGEKLKLKESCPKLFYLFFTDNTSSYDPYESLSAYGGISGSDLYNYMLEISNSIGGETVETKNGKLSSVIFDDDIDENRKRNDDLGIIKKGYSFYDFDARLSIDKWKSWDDNSPSFWDNVDAFGFWNALFNDIPHESGKVVQPIIDLKDKDFIGSSIDISNNLMVNKNDVTALREFYNNNKKDNHIIAFRFAVSDYYSAPTVIYDYKNIPSVIREQTYHAKQTVFLDFNVIQLTFMDNDNTLSIFPVVSSPIDIVDDITSPVSYGGCNSNWRSILGLILFIVLFALLFPFLKPILTIVIEIISVPFRLLAALFKNLRKSKPTAENTQKSAVKDKPKPKRKRK